MVKLIPVGSATAAIALSAITACIAPVAASAASLRYESGVGSKVVGIDGLEVGGELLNVDFKFGSFNSIFSEDPFFRGEKEAAGEAADKISQLLGQEAFTTVFQGTTKFDGFYVAYERPEDSPNHGFFGYWADDPRFEKDEVKDINQGFNPNDIGPLPFATFKSAEGGTPQATPEPSLIFSFITLGGLMLASKRKTKG